jgi:hypothetical protein
LAAEPWFDLGILHADAGRKDAAAKPFDEAIKRDGASPWAKAARLRKAALN